MYLSASKNNISGLDFLLKRFFRVAPVYWFYTLLVVICIFFIPEITTLTDYNVTTLLASLFFIPIENPSPSLKIFPLLSVGWTLNFEMMFYLILSITIMISRKRAIIICFMTILALPAFYPDNILFSEVLTSELLYEFISGFVVAFLIEKSYTTHFLSQNKMRLTLIVGGFILSAVCFSLFEFHVLFKLLGSAFIVFSVALLNFYLNRDHWLIKFLVNLGDISYSTYLAHTFVLMFYMHYVGSWLHPVNDMIVLSIIVYLISKCSYYLIEKNQYIEKLKQFSLGIVR